MDMDEYMTLMGVTFGGNIEQKLRGKTGPVNRLKGSLLFLARKIALYFLRII